MGEKLITGVKHDNSKIRLDLIPVKPLIEIGKVYTFGCIKYSPNSWQNLEDFESRYYAALLRHLFAWRDGEWLDPESKLPHLAHVGWNVIALLWKGLNND